MTDLERVVLQKNLDTLTRLGERIGEWTDKVDARTTGVTIHIKFQKAQPDAMLAVEFAQVMQSCPAMLADAIRRLLALTEAQQSGDKTAPCCDLHQPIGCCDSDDCGPCCKHCPTCPTLNKKAEQ